MPKLDTPCAALASWSEVVDTDKFIDRMAFARTTISKTEILAVFQLAREELTSLLADGCYVKTPFGAAMPRATGKFKNPSESFQPRRKSSGHGIRFDFQLDPAIAKKALAKLRCVRAVDVDRLSPLIASFASVESGKEGEASCGDLLKITGRRLKFDPSDLGQGVFFRRADGAERRASRNITVRPSELIVGVPADAEAGEWQIISQVVV